MAPTECVHVAGLPSRPNVCRRDQWPARAHSAHLRRIRSRTMEQALADLVGPDLRVLFCGINPGTLSGELGLHFARTGNRFWKLLCAGGFTKTVLSPAEQPILPAL